jgi:hypothetical protein
MYFLAKKNTKGVTEMNTQKLLTYSGDKIRNVIKNESATLGTTVNTIEFV